MKHAKFVSFTEIGAQTAAKAARLLPDFLCERYARTVDLALDKPRGQLFELPGRQKNDHGRAVRGKALDLLARGDGRTALHARQDDRLADVRQGIFCLERAAAPQNDETPGQTSYASPSLSSASICSRCAP